MGGIIALLLLPAMASLLRDVEPLHETEVTEHKAHPAVVGARCGYRGDL